MTITRSRTRNIVVTLALAMIAGISTHTTAVAQAPCIKSYTVAVLTSVPPGCLPMTVSATWSNGLTGVSVISAYGFVVEVAPNPPGCWQLPLTSLTINGVAIPVPLDGIPVNIGCGTVTVGAVTSATGTFLGLVIS